MKTFVFARNTTREYFEVSAEDEAAARAALTAGEDQFYSGRRDTDTDEQPFELIDVED